MQKSFFLRKFALDKQKTTHYDKEIGPHTLAPMLYRQLCPTSEHPYKQSATSATPSMVRLATP